MTSASAASSSASDPAATVAALDFVAVSVTAPERPGTAAPPLLLRDVDWRVARGEHWAVLGGNGAGKTTLLRTAAGALPPSAGRVTILGERLGAIGLRDPRLRMAVLPSRPGTFSQRLTALDVVLLREAGPVALLGKAITPDEVRRAKELLDLFGCTHLRDARYGVCSQGERQRILLARALMRRPAVLLLDEPTAGLDLPGREGLLAAMERLAAEQPELATVTVTHHVEELPASTTHALLLREGRVIAQGAVGDVLTEERLTETLGLPVSLVRLGDRWAARARA
jgi:iron complex transport system ATP-binding protein